MQKVLLLLLLSIGLFHYLIYLGQYERFWNILCRMISKRACGLEKFFCTFVIGIYWIMCHFCALRICEIAGGGITKVRITHGSPFDGPTKYYLVPKLKAYLRTPSCFCTYRTSKNHCRYFLHGFYPHYLILAAWQVSIICFSLNKLGAKG